MNCSDSYLIVSNILNIRIHINDILYCHADSSYTIIYLKDHKKHLATKNIGYITKILPSNRFLRPHNSYIVNKGHIISFDVIQRVITVEGNHSIPVSYRKLQKTIIDLNIL